MPSTAFEIGSVEGWLEDPQPVGVAGDEASHVRADVPVEVVPDEDDRRAELHMVHDDQVPVAVSVHAWLVVQRSGRRLAHTAANQHIHMITEHHELKMSNHMLSAVPSDRVADEPG
ncbi:hypothetical protein ABT340_12440 [Streptosporangium sp. NPDC000239]|uniref:hypothetical protein n=1 Tax=Streptosporangium sp. NPDC000239 TaxID=3154248 RepID=UPI00332C21E3